MDVLLVAAKKEKIADYTGVIAQAGRTAVDRRRRRLRAAERLRGQLRPRARTDGRPAQRRRERDQHQHPHGDQSVFTRDISIGGNAYTEALQKELNLQFDAADALKKGQPGDGVTTTMPAGPARRHREHDARDSEDLRLLQGDGRVRSHRSDRRSAAGRRAPRASPRCSADRFESPVEWFDPFKTLGFDTEEARRRAPAEIAPTAAVAVGLALRRVGDR